MPAILFGIASLSPTLSLADESSLLDFFNQHSAVMLMVDPDSGNIVNANDAALQFYGYGEDKMRGMNIDQLGSLVSSGDQIASKSDFDIIKSGERTFFSSRHNVSKNQSKPVEIHYAPYEIDGEAVFIMLVNDASFSVDEDSRFIQYQQRLEAVVDGMNNSLTATRNESNKWKKLAITTQTVAIFTLLIVLSRLIYQNIRLRQLSSLSDEAKEELEKSNRQMKHILTNSPSIIFILDPASLRKTFVTNNASKIYHDSIYNIIGNKSWWIKRIHPEDRSASLKAFHEWRIKGCQGSFKNTYRIRTHLFKNEYIWVEDQIYASRNPDGTVNELIGIQFDITDRKAVEAQMELAASVFDYAREGIVITHSNGDIIDVNDAFTQITGYSKEELIGQNPRLLKSGKHDVVFYEKMWTELIENGYWEGETINCRKGGEVYNQLIRISSVRDDNGRLKHYVALISDVTLQKKNEEKLYNIAHYDVLTGLPNRNFISDILQEEMVKEHDNPFAVLFIDLDNFKMINDEFGHDMGDKFLIEAASRMRSVLSHDDMISRFGGDEFIAILKNRETRNEYEAVVNNIIKEVSLPVHIKGVTLESSASIGITLYPQVTSLSSDQLIRQADQAMYLAKLAGRNRFHVFDAEKEQDKEVFNKDIDEIELALENGEFELYYQPKVNMRTGQVLGVEALIRWNHPEKGLLQPFSFLPKIDKHYMDIKIGEWVISQAIRQIEAWQSIGLDLTISVNISGYHLQQHNFVDSLISLLSASPDVPHNRLEIEVLETNAIEDVNHISTVISFCDKIGINVSLDDFGTGYSSLTFLKNIPAKTLKIDRSFVRDMLDDPNDLAILEGVMGLAKAFHRDVVAEGVETKDHGNMLLQLGCDIAQGYFIAKPMPASEIVPWVDQWKTNDEWSGQQRLEYDRMPILQISVEHRSWVKQIINYIDGKQDEAPEIICSGCKFEQWITSVAVEHLEYEKINRLKYLHCRLRDVGTEAINLMVAGERKEALARITQLMHFKNQFLDEVMTIR
jgi:diguanylate cyclase (GGDEF)-like protein/PAS domain S-box-containing protein